MNIALRFVFKEFYRTVAPAALVAAGLYFGENFAEVHALFCGAK